MKRLYRIGLGVAVVLILGGLLVGIHMHRSKPTISVAPQQAPKQSYVAMGDSIAAGLGLATASDPSACGRTNESYPHLVAQSLHLQLRDVTCSGATIAQGITGAQSVNRLMTPPQIDAALRSPKPTLVSLTIGANDIDWGSFLGTCYTADCGSPADSLRIATALQGLSAHMHAMLDRIQQQYGQRPPRVVVTGYYHIFPVQRPANCFDLTGLSSEEMNWWRSQEDALNRTISAAVADYSFVRYAPVNFTGHELCSDNAWVQEIQASAPYHPTADGQAALAKAVVTASAAK